MVQGLLSAVPGGGFINNCLQTTLGNLRDFEANVDGKVVGDWLVLLSHMQELGVRPQNRGQAGNGGYPVLPVCTRLPVHAVAALFK